jgi:hypothetical protein
MVNRFEIGEYVFTKDGLDTKDGHPAPRLRIVTGYEGTYYQCRTVEGELSISFRPENLREATRKEVDSYRADKSYAGENTWSTKKG